MQAEPPENIHPRSHLAPRRLRGLLLAVLLGSLSSLAFTAVAQADLYWGNSGNGTIGHSTQDGTVFNQAFVSGASTPVGVAADANYIYWANAGTNSIGRANLDGTDANPNFITGASHPLGVAVNGSYIYWTNYGNDTIGRANLSGTGANQSFIQSPATPTDDVAAIAVDSSHIYWIDEDSGYIGRANLDGSGATDSFINAASSEYGLAVDDSHIYWTNSSNNWIGRANLDGTGVNEAFITGANYPYGITVDGSYVYWTNYYGAGTNSNTIGRAKLDGTSVVQSFIPGGANPTGLVATGPAGPTVSVGDASAVEPAGANGTLSFPVTLSIAQSTAVTVDYSTSDGSATAGHDYDAAAGTLTIPAGSTAASIPVTLHNVGKEGNKTFTITLSDPSAGINLGQATATGTIHGLGPLGVAVTWLRDGVPLALPGPNNTTLANTLRLADTDSGEVAQDITAQVTITNTSNTTQTNISVNGIPAFSYHNPANALQALPVAVTSGPFPTSIPNLEPGQSFQMTYGVHVTNNGVFDLSPQILSSDQGTGDTNVSNGVGTVTALPTALLWVSLHPRDQNAVRAGLPFYVEGTVTNRSLTQTIDIDPLEPTDSGNAGGGGLDDITDAPLADGVKLPLLGEIAPGQTINVEGQFSTGYVSGTRAEATYDPSGAIVNPDGTETNLTASQVGMSSGSSPVHISVDNTDPAVPAVTVDTLFNSISDAAMLGTTEWMYNDVNAGVDLLEHPIVNTEKIGKGIADFVVGSTKDATEAAFLVSAMYTLAEGAKDMTPEQQGEFANGIVADYESSHLGGDVNQIKKAADQVLPTFFDAVSTGDWNKVASLSTTGLVTGAGLAADQMLTDIAFQKLALGVKVGASKALDSSGEIARAIILKDAIRDAGVSSVIGKGLEGVEAGTNLLARNGAALFNAFGLTSKQVTELMNYCEREKIIIAVRSRSKRAAQLIREGLAVGKNEAIKLKAVNSYDTEFLGYSRHDLNQVVWAEPVPESYVEAKLKGASEETREIVTARYKARVAEWHDEAIRKVIEDGERTGRIDWGFNGADNNAPRANRAGERRFALKDQPNPQGGKGGGDRTYQQVLVGNQPGLASNIRLVPVTQDVDLMAVLSQDGSILSAEQRTAAYIHLSDILGIEHPETPTWIKDGEILFQKKAKQLADVVPGGEPLAVISPVRTVTAGYFDPALTIFDNQTLGGRIFFKGGYNNPYAKAATALKLSLKGTLL